MIHKVDMADFLIGQSPDILATYGLGSCIGIALYDPRTRRGALSHTLLPFAPSPCPLHPKYVDHALHMMLTELCSRGVDPARLLAKMAGGAEMFSFSAHPEQGIGYRNTLSARKVLGQLAIPLVAEDVGGSHGRSLFLDLSTGEIRVRSFRGDVKLKTF